MKLNKYLATGAVLLGLASGAVADNSKQNVYDKIINGDRVMYKEGVKGYSPDIMYIYTEKGPELDTIKPTNIYPAIQVFNDYDGDGTIGNHSEDRCVIMVSTIAKGKDLFRFIPISDTESKLRDPSKFMYSLSDPLPKQLSYYLIGSDKELETRKFGGRIVCGRYACLGDDKSVIIDGTSSVSEDLLESIDFNLKMSTSQYKYYKQQIFNKVDKK